MILSDIQELVAKGKTLVAIKKLMELIEKVDDIELKNQIILLSSQYYQYENDDLIGLPNENSKLIKVEYAILQIINKLENRNELFIEKNSDRDQNIYLSNELPFLNSFFNSAQNRFRNEKWDKLRSKVYSWLINDQIKETGAWGLSTNNMDKLVYNRQFTEFELKEGGFVATHIALKALFSYEKNKLTFRNKIYAKKSLDYYLKRQSVKGGFGRILQSRSGNEILPSIRHTAFVLSSILDLNAPSAVISKAIDYLKSNWQIDNILNDASPSFAIVSTIHSIDKFLKSNINEMILDNDNCALLDLNNWEEIKYKLLKNLIELSRSSEYFPHWKPYANNSKMLFLTSLITIDLLPIPLPKFLVPTIIDILTMIINDIKQNGVPFSVDIQFPDIGMSSVLLYLIHKKGFIQTFDNSDILLELISISERLENFILTEFENDKYWEYTNANTISYLLLLPYKNNFDNERI